MNYNAYIAHNLNEDEFESLSNYLASRLNGSEIISYANGRDGGKDGRRIGFSKNIDQWRSSGSKFIIQAKHTSDSNASCSDQKFFGNKKSIIAEEIDKIINLKSNNELEYYLLFTNRKYTGLKDSNIRKSISKAVDLDINNIEIFGIETINHLLNLSSNTDLVLQFNLHPNPDRLKTINTSILKPIILSIEDKPILLDNLKFDNINYVDRKFVKPNDENNIYYYGQTIEQIIEDEDFICVLGNPGTGKTTTLKKIALDFWMDGEQTDYTPIYKSLKNFTANNTIENFLPEKHKDLSKIIFIFDGIDEIANINNFKAELGNFIQKNQETKNKKSKYIISCRSNIFNKEVFNLKEFKTYHIHDLSYNESISLLKQLCNSTLIDSLKFNSKLIDFIKTPLQVKVLASYINQHHQLSENVGLLWKDYINKRLTIDEQEKLVNRPFNPLLIKKESTKIGFINELRNTLVIDEETLLNLFKSDYNICKEFVKNPLLDKSNNTYSFENRNIQEYFAATAISKFSVKEVINLIKVEDLNIIQPNLLNTLTFLIDLVDTEKATELTNWLYNNQPEILFSSDSNRISKEHRTYVFQNYFKQTCIEKHYWIGNSIDTKQIALFGDCIENFDYLIEIISNPKYHFRITQSALSLLSHFTIIGKETELIEFFTKILKNPKTKYTIKSECLRTIKEHNLTLYDKSLLGKIVRIFKEIDDKRCCKNILDLIDLNENIDDYFDFIHLEFKRYNGLLKRKEEDKTHYGTEYVLDKLLHKIENGNHFIELITFYLNDATNSYHFVLTEELINKTTEFIKKDKNLIVLLYKFIEDKKLFYSKIEVIFKEIVDKSNSKEEVYNHLIKNININELYYLSHFVSSNNLETTLQTFQNKKITNKGLEQFRNLLGNCNSRNLAREFEKLLSSKKIVLQDKFQTKEDLELISKEAKEFVQSNFDILFNKEKLTEELILIFKKPNNVITEDNYKTLRREWWKQNLHFYSNKNNNIYTIINHILHIENNSKEINIKETLEFIDKYPILLIKLIVDNINANNGSYTFEINQHHIDYIQNWCHKTITEINLDEVLIINNNTYSYHGSTNYKKIKFIHFFVEKLKIDIPVDFLIQTIPYYKLDSFNQQDKLSEIKEWINNEALFNKQIIFDVKNNRLTNHTFKEYITYAINHHLSEITVDIIEYFKNSEYVNSNEFEKFIIDFNLKHTLKDYCININSMVFWRAIDMMIEHESYHDFCISKSLEYLESTQSNYNEKALNVLFYTKHKLAIKHAIKLIMEMNPRDNEIIINCGNYDYYDNSDDIIKLYILFYANPIASRYDLHTYIDFYRNYLKNISKDNHVLVQKKLETIKKTYGKTEDDLFYINMIIDESNDSYISSLSKPMNLNEAISYVDKI